MKRPEYLFCASVVLLAVSFEGCARRVVEAPAIASAELKAFAPLPEVASGKEPITGEKFALGRMLYYEARLSKSQKVSCNSCHGLSTYGVDNQPTSEGHKGQR